MNDKFKNILKKHNISAYRLSKDTGVSYTTINELVNEKISINNVSAEKVFKLSLYLGCSIEDLLNDFSMYDKLEGKYRGRSYHWEQKKRKINVYVCEHDKPVVVKSMKSINTNQPYKFARVYAEALIDSYLREREKETLYEKLYLDAQRH